MSLLAKKYVESTRQARRIRQEMADLLRRNDALLKHDEHLRRAELKKVQREFYKAILSDLIRDEAESSQNSDDQIVRYAEQLLDKKGFIAGRNAKSEGRRTYREHQHYGTLRVRWTELAKAAGIRAIDSRGG